MELKQFFSGNARTKFAGERNVSAQEIKMRMQQIIDTEDISRPLSDRKIWEKLREEGFELKERVVNKYRNALNIPPAGTRKRLKSAVA